MSVSRALSVSILTAGLLAACGSSASTDTTAGATSAPVTQTTEPGTTGPATSGGGSATTPTSADSTSSSVVALEQPAIWPAADVRFATPDDAAADFVTEVLGVPVQLGEFMQGDSRSGEIELQFNGENGTGPAIVRSVLLVRQLGPANSWFVLAAVNDNASITSPQSAATVPAGPLTVEGVARGFEGAVTVSALVAGDAQRQLDQVQTQGGSLETPEPFSVTLDLSDAVPGETVMLLVKGGVGLETDPGEVGAIPVVIGS